MNKPPNYIIRQGRIIDPANLIDRIDDVFIANGLIQAIGKQPDNFQAGIEINAKDRILCPGFIDLWSRLQEPSLHDKTTIESEINAAVANGITTLCAPPDRTPITDSPAMVEMIQQCARESGKLQILPISALTKDLKGEEISEMAALKVSGCRILSNARAAITNTLTLRRALEYAASHDFIVFLHPEDAWLAENGVMHEGEVSTRLGLPAIPDAAESIAVARDLALIERTGVKAHFCHISSHKALNLIQEAQAKGMQITASVTISHLFLSEMDLLEYNSYFHLQPPLRTLADQQRLREGVQKGVIQAICSDHTPLPDDAKLAPFQATTPGASTIDVFLSLLFKLVEENVLTYSQAIATVTSQPAKILGLNIGTLRPGNAANLCIINPEFHWQVRTDKLLSKGLNCPFLQWGMKGHVEHTFFSGRPVYSRSGCS